MGTRQNVGAKGIARHRLVLVATRRPIAFVHSCRPPKPASTIFELAASDAETAWQHTHTHQSDMAHRELVVRQAHHLVQYSIRE